VNSGDFLVKFAPKGRKIRPNGEISPNLVALLSVAATLIPGRIFCL
jgi:hypothetical protein